MRRGLSHGMSDRTTHAFVPWAVPMGHNIVNAMLHVTGNIITYRIPQSLSHSYILWSIPQDLLWYITLVVPRDALHTVWRGDQWDAPWVILRDTHQRTFWTWDFLWTSITCVVPLDVAGLSIRWPTGWYGYDRIGFNMPIGMSIGWVLHIRTYWHLR